MPVFNARGDVLAGIGTAPITINGEAINVGGRGGWLDLETVVYNRRSLVGVAGDGDASGELAAEVWDVVTHRRNAAPVVVLPGGANVTDGGGGVWAAWNATGLYVSTGVHLPAAGAGTVGPDGAVAYCPDYQDGRGVDVREVVGDVWRLTDGVAYDVQLLGARRAVWTERQVVRVAGLPEPAPAIRDAFRPRVAWLAGVPWVCYWSAGRERIVLRPLEADPLEGYELEPGDKFTHDCEARGGIFRVVWAHGEGEHVNTITAIDPTAPRVPLGPTPPEPPDPGPGPPDPEPEVEAPRATITDYAPHDGVAPLTVTAHARLTGGDPPTTIEWLDRAQGAAEWRAVQSDAWEHVYGFPAGVWEIGLRVRNAGGGDETRTPRIVTVHAAPEPPDPPEPTPPPAPLEYDTFVNVECPDVAVAYQSVNPDPSVPTPQQMGHTSWRRLIEAWTHRDIIHDIKGEPLEDGGAGGATNPPPDPGPTPPDPGPIPPGTLTALRQDGRILRTADGARFLWRGATSFRLLHMVATGEEAAAVERLEALRALGFSVVRVLATARHLFDLPADRGRDALRRLFDLTGAAGLYVEIVALADTDTWTRTELEEQLAYIYTRAGEYPHVLVEGGNELGPTHETQSDAAVDVCRNFVPGGPALYCPGSVHGGGFCQDRSALTDEQWEHGNATGEWPYWDEVFTYSNHYGTSHLKRDGDDANRGRRVRELEASSDQAECLFIDDEPLGADETLQPGKRSNEPGVFYLQGVLSRIFEVGSTFHSQAGLTSAPFGPVQQGCAEAFINGTRIVADGVQLTYKNAGWHDSPVKEFTGAVRIYSGVGADNIACVIGPENDYRVVYQHGWSSPGPRAVVTGCHVLNLATPVATTSRRRRRRP
jgi:hypothetical protein